MRAAAHAEWEQGQRADQQQLNLGPRAAEKQVNGSCQWLPITSHPWFIVITARSLAARTALTHWLVGRPGFLLPM